MARLKPGCLGIRSVILVTLVAVMAMVFMVSPVAANCGPDTKVNPNNTNADDIPWVEFTDRPGTELWVGPQYRVMNVGYWLVEAGLVGSADNSQIQYPENGSRERNTADENPYLTDPK